MLSQLAQIAALDGYPLDIFQKAAETITAHTGVAAAYVAVVAPPEQADFAWPDQGDADEEVAGGAAAETDDEAEDNPPPPPPPEEGEEAEAGGEERAGGEEGDGEVRTVCLSLLHPIRCLQRVQVECTHLAA